MASKAVTDIGSGIKKAAEAVKEKFCVVCGLGSHRKDWQDKDVVACDSHSKDEVTAAQKEAAKAQTPAPPASTPSTPTAPPTSNPPTTPTT